ncbi:3-hydroxybenzoate 6-hydroxylase 1 [Nymphon striatum]|nr:3-hydroxybenzoate 6-hydroxylase 1 [Nymphon striatum]
MTQKRAVIAGGGIGGLASGLALAQSGWEVEVLEQAPELFEVGAGIQALVQALRAQPSAQMRTNAKVTGYVRERGGASVYLERGDRVFGNVVVGADGVRSEIRNQMCGSDRARFTGNVAWRSVVPVDALGDDAPPPFGVIWAGRGKHAVTTRVKGGSHVNFVGIVEQDDWTEEGWSIPGSIEDALTDFGDWQPCLKSVLEASGGLFRWALYSRPALATWCDGPVTLLGDAAHPMLPSMAQGAVMALEDAVVLAEMLQSEENHELALQAYEKRRKPRTTRVQQRSAMNAHMFHRHTTIGQIATYAPMAIASRMSAATIHRQQDWIYSFGSET